MALGDRLTPREVQVLALVAGGRQDKQISRELDIDAGTVAFHLGNAMESLGACNRAHAVYLAVQAGYSLEATVTS
jgi:DNA-binding NarL/FixJ family response regulator